MIFRITALWIAGGVFIVPYSIYYLLYYAQRDEYAFWIVFPLFWVFGFWGVVGPLIAAWRVHRLMSALDRAGSRQELVEAFQNNEGEEAIIYLIASENRIPRFAARWIYKRVEPRLREKLRDRPMPPMP